MHEINRSEKDSILYYQGGGADIVLSPEKQNLREFYNVDNSYVAINALLMPGISNEKARLVEEGRKVGLSMFKHMDELVKVYCRLYSAMCKYTYLYEHEDEYHTYRADRMNTLGFLRDGQMYSFMSTQKCNDKNKDFHDKNGILLLEIEAPGSIEHVNVNAVLEKESKYPHEQEILFAPFAFLDMEPLEMTDEEKDYTDIHDNPPEAKYLLHLRLSSIVPCKADRNGELEELYQEVTSPDSIDNAIRVWETFMSKKEPEADAVQYYVEWKRKLQIYIRMRFARIKYRVTVHNPKAGGECGAGVRKDTDERQDKDGGQSADYNQNINDKQDSSDTQEFWDRWYKLEEDIRNYYNYTDEKRKKYKHYIQIVNMIVSVLYTSTTFFIALSFVNEWQVCMKVISLLSSAIGSIASLVAKGFAWNEKLQQRTTTYMELDRLMRDMRYEKSLDENNFDRYMERYKVIRDEDDRMGLENAILVGNYSEKIAKESENKQGMGNGQKE